MKPIVEQFCEYYRELNHASIGRLDQLYDNKAVLIDPLHSIEGIDAISHYFETMLTNLSYCRFQIIDVLDTNHQAFVTWVMHFAHPRLNKGKAIEVTGSSHLKFDQKLIYHRDYYDLGEMLYEQIPVLGFVIDKLKQRLTA